eukprot:m51a1_g900 hypothetical protein (121) ;mRNA; r:44251-44693
METVRLASLRSAIRQTLGLDRGLHSSLGVLHMSPSTRQNLLQEGVLVLVMPEAPHPLQQAAHSERADEFSFDEPDSPRLRSGATTKRPQATHRDAAAAPHRRTSSSSSSSSNHHHQKLGV